MSPRIRVDRRRCTVVVALIVAGLLAGCVSDEPPSWADQTGGPTSDSTTDTTNGGSVDRDAPPGSDTIDWGPCVDDDVSDAFDCGWVTVPLDHDDPDGDTLDLALIRLEAAGTRRGSVLVNPGGPGGSGFDYVAAVGEDAVFRMGLRNHDLIGFDPRGVDRSGGIRCLSDAELDEVMYLDGNDEIDDDLFEYDDRFTEGCLERYGDTLAFYSTVQTARDMDVIRDALGLELLDYIGISYGTYLGAVYTTLFPDRVGAFVLDSGFEPTGDSIEEQYLTQAEGFEGAFDAWADSCDPDEGCPFDDDPGDEWDRLLERLRTDPVPAEDGRFANAAVLETATVASLYDPLTWAILTQAMAQVEEGDPSLLFLLADSYVGRNADGTYLTISQSNTIISCASGFTRDTPDDPEAIAELMRDRAPRFAGEVTADDFGDDCSDLMTPGVMPELSNTGDGRFLVIGGLNDPATPFRWSEKLAEGLGGNAALVTWDGEGHGMLFSSSCLRDLASDLIRRGELPDDGVVCEPDPPVDRPDWWDDVPIPDGVSEPLDPIALALLGLPPEDAYGEVRTAVGSMDDLITLYRNALDTERSFRFLADEQPEEWFTLAVFLGPGGSTFLVGVIDAAARDDPDLTLVFDLLGTTDSLVVVAYFP